jgi:hypothetical protein
MFSQVNCDFVGVMRKQGGHVSGRKIQLTKNRTISPLKGILLIKGQGQRHWIVD